MNPSIDRSRERQRERQRETEREAEKQVAVVQDEMVVDKLVKFGSEAPDEDVLVSELKVFNLTFRERFDSKKIKNTQISNAMEGISILHEVKTQDFGDALDCRTMNRLLPQFDQKTHQYAGALASSRIGPKLTAVIGPARHVFQEIVVELGVLKVNGDKVKACIENPIASDHDVEGDLLQKTSCRAGVR